MQLRGFWRGYSSLHSDRHVLLPVFRMHDTCSMHLLLLDWSTLLRVTSGEGANILSTPISMAIFYLRARKFPIRLYQYFSPDFFLAGVCDQNAVYASVYPDINFRTSWRIFTNLHMDITALEVISMSYFLNMTHKWSFEALRQEHRLI
jgi:hypothetical protein